MTPCRARWEFRFRRTPAGLWAFGDVFVCAGSRYNPDPCELHGCGEVLDPRDYGPDVVSVAVFHHAGLCVCPTPEAVSA